MKLLLQLVSGRNIRRRGAARAASSARGRAKWLRTKSFSTPSQSRVYITGLSAGGAMTSAMLAA
jgi:hypothetical protein